MVRLEVIDLFPKHDSPQVLTDELDNVKRLDHAGAISRKPLYQSLPNFVAQLLQTVEHSLALLVIVEGYRGAAAAARRGFVRETPRERHDLYQEEVQRRGV